MASRGFTSSPATINSDSLAIKFENMLSKVNNMIKSQSVYSVWIRLTIGKDNPIVFNSSSQAQNENMIMSLDYEKTGIGTANKFTFKVAFDLFNYGQETKGIVEKLDELLYKAMNVASLDKADEVFYCKFQYGYNVVGDTQIVSPQYEGFISDIVPSIDYTSGKTYYTITGLSFVKDTGFNYSFDAIGNIETGEGGWKGLDLVLWILWYYHGNNDTVSSIYDVGYANNLNNHSEDWNNGIADRYNIDIPAELAKTSSEVCLEQMSDMSAIDYCKEVLKKTKNTADPRYDAESGTYKLKEGETEPRYVLYITDSAGDSHATVHVAYIGSSGDLSKLAGIRTINFPFEWFNRENNIVLKWNPEVKLMAYFLTRARQERDRLKYEKQKKEAEDSQAEALKNLQKELSFVGPRTFLDWARSAAAVLANTAKLAVAKAAEISANGKLQEIQNATLEYYNSSMTLVGIPSDIPLNIMLKIKPKILESVSRTQGTYYVTGAKDSINTNGLFTTTIDLFRYANY